MQAAAQTTLNQTFNYVFEHADTFMTLPSLDRIAKINSNSVALSTDYNENLGNIDLNQQNKGVWVRPYSAFENLPLKHGPKVDVISYGTFVGFDSDIHKLKHGWANVGTAYLGYNGSQMNYGNVDSTMNGGLLGLTETFYKGNFFTALTATAGAGITDTNTMYGHEDGTFLMGGIGSKTGYNFEFKGGKYIVQPIMFMSYSLVKGFDYTNAAGVKIDSDPSHTVQLHPSVRFIGNFGSWQPYASVGMVWDLLHESNTKANGVKLPEMYTKPYVQYGVGLQRCWDDKFSAFGQAMIRNGGRNGISLTFGFRWALGKGAEKVSNPSPKTVKTAKPSKVTQSQPAARKVIKQMSSDKRAKLQNTTSTSMNAVIY
jgi:outer membrane autotransporter protein